MSCIYPWEPKTTALQWLPVKYTRSLLDSPPKVILFLPWHKALLFLVPFLQVMLGFVVPSHVGFVRFMLLMICASQSQTLYHKVRPRYALKKSASGHTCQLDFLSLQGRLPMYFPSISLSALAPSIGSPNDANPKPARKASFTTQLPALQSFSVVLNLIQVIGENI